MDAARGEPTGYVWPPTFLPPSASTTFFPSLAPALGSSRAGEHAHVGGTATSWRSRRRIVSRPTRSSAFGGCPPTSAGPFMVGVDCSCSRGPVDRPVPASAPITTVGVFGDADFTSNRYFYAFSNSDLFLNAVNHMIGDEALISIRPKPTVFREMAMTPRELESRPLYRLVPAPATGRAARFRRVVGAALEAWSRGACLAADRTGRHRRVCARSTAQRRTRRRSPPRRSSTRSVRRDITGVEIAHDGDARRFVWDERSAGEWVFDDAERSPVDAGPVERHSSSALRTSRAAGPTPWIRRAFGAMDSTTLRRRSGSVCRTGG